MLGSDMRDGETGRACRCRDGRLAADRALAVRPLAVEGWASLQDRPDRPHRSPARVPPRRERETERMRRGQKLGPARIAARFGMHASTVRVLCPPGRLIRSNKHPGPGDLLHVDLKKRACMPPGDVWRAQGRGHAPDSGAGYASSTPPWTTAHASPTARSSPMNAPLRRSRSSVGRARFSAHGVGTRWRRWLWGCHRAWRAMVGVRTERWPS